MSDSGIIASIGGAVAAGLALLGFWTKYIVDRIAGAKEIAVRAEAKADVAQQEAAEAKNETRDMRELIENLTRDMHDGMVRIGRETGESNAAIRQHITESLFFVRDNFARRDEVAADITEIKESQKSMEEKLDDIRDRLPRKN